jgi:hypothetical protein
MPDPVSLFLLRQDFIEPGAQVRRDRRVPDLPVTECAFQLPPVILQLMRVIQGLHMLCKIYFALRRVSIE